MRRSSWHRTCNRAPVTVRLLVALSLGLLALRPVAAQAASDASPRVSIAALLRDQPRLTTWLVDHSPEIAAARARLFQSRADARQSRALPNPVLDASLANLALGRTNPPGLGFEDTAIYSVGLSQTVELGKRGPRRAGAELRQRSAAFLLASVERDELGRARYALGRALHRALRVAILAETLADAERAAELERVRYEQQQLSGNDYDRLLLELANLRGDFERERAEYSAALAECAAVLGADCDASGAEESDLAGALPLDVERASSAELGRTPEPRAMDAERQAAERDAELARARAVPDVTLRVGYTHDRFLTSGDNENTLMFGVVLPLPVFDRGQHDASKALARAAELREMRRAHLRQARAERAGLLSRRAALEQGLARLERESLPRSSRVLSASQIAFERGGMSLTDLLLARRTQLALTLTRLDERFELFGVHNELQRVLAGAGEPITS